MKKCGRFFLLDVVDFNPSTADLSATHHPIIHPFSHDFIKYFILNCTLYRPSALMTLPRAVSDLLIVAPSFSRDRLVSRPARSLSRGRCNHQAVPEFDFRKKMARRTFLQDRQDAAWRSFHAVNDRRRERLYSGT